MRLSKSTGLTERALFSLFLLFLTVFATAEVRAARPGTPDLTFGNSGSTIWFGFRTNAIAIQSDGRILTGGIVRQGQNDVDFTLARYNADGSIDTSFGGGLARVTTSVRQFSDVLLALVIQPDGKIVAGGYTNRGPSEQFDPFDIVLARYNPDGSLDTTFGTGGITMAADGANWASAARIVLQPDGQILVSGNNRVARFTANGAFDTSFGDNGWVRIANNTASGLALQANGRIVAGGRGGPAFNDFQLNRFNADGTVDTTFGVNGVVVTTFPGAAELNALAVQPDGQIVAGGAAFIGGERDFALARYNPNGTLDQSFGTGGQLTTAINQWREQITSLALQRNGRIVAGGETVYNGTHVGFGIVRYNPNGTVDQSFGTDGKVTTVVGDTSSLKALAIQNDGRIVAAGDNFFIGGASNNALLVRYFNNAPPLDFDGDAVTDAAGFDPVTGQWRWRYATGGSGSATIGQPGDLGTAADYTGDGFSDPAVFRPSDGNWYILDSARNTLEVRHFGISGDVPIPGDYDGDGKTDIAVYRPSDGYWYLAPSTGGVRYERFGLANDIPAAADFDGDGRTDIAIFRPSTGQWWINRTTAGLIVSTFGQTGDLPVAADYTGDGLADLAVWRPATGQWFVVRSENGSYFALTLGATGDQPAVGDYDGDGLADPAVYRPSSSTVYAYRSSAGPMTTGL